MRPANEKAETSTYIKVSAYLMKIKNSCALIVDSEVNVEKCSPYKV